MDNKYANFSKLSAAAAALGVALMLRDFFQGVAGQAQTPHRLKSGIPLIGVQFELEPLGAGSQTGVQGRSNKVASLTSGSVPKGEGVEGDAGLGFQSTVQFLPLGVKVVVALNAPNVAEIAGIILGFLKDE